MNRSGDVFMTVQSLFEQTFNYHLHVFRDSNSVKSEDMLEMFKRIGVLTLGFSEYIPNPDLILPDEDNRMLISEVDEYIKSINNLKNNTLGMTVLTGFTADYNPICEAFLGEMRKKVDYMILEQHGVTYGFRVFSPYNNPNYPIEYANTVSMGIESGIFDIVAHPDYFMKFRGTITSKEDMKLFDENAILASQRICEKAKDMGIPIEIDLSEVLNNWDLHHVFWKIAQEIEGLQIIEGIGNVETLKNIEKVKQAILPIEQMLFGKIIRNNYNPVIARKNNKKLQEIYIKRQENVLSFETNVINQIIKETFKNTGDNFDSKSLAISIFSSLDSTMKNCFDEAEKKINDGVKEVPSTIDGKTNLRRKKQVINDTSRTLQKQRRVMENAKNNVIEAINIGCETKQEFSNILAQIMQYQTTQRQEQREKIDSHIARFQYLKTGKNTKRNYKLDSVYGFTNFIMLGLLIMLLLCLVVGICFMVYKINMGG